MIASASVRPPRAGGRGRLLERVPLSWRGVALMPLAILAVHQLRYVLAYGSGAGRELAEQGHAYLGDVLPFAVLCAALALGGFAGRLARAWSGHGAAPCSPRRRAARLWLACAAILLALYCAQELCEGLLATGHPAGLAGVLGDGGWWALPLSVAVGGLLALALRAAATVLAAVSRARRPARSAPSLHSQAPGHPAPGRPRLSPLARRAAGRAPPRLLRSRAVPASSR